MFVNVDKIIEDSPDTTFFEFVGRRGCGKTYGVKRYCIEHFLETGKAFLYVRRGRDEVKPTQMNYLFSDLEQQQPELFEAFNAGLKITGAHVVAYGGYFWIANSQEKRVRQIGAYQSISKAKSFKGLPHNDIDVIFFDEVITEDGYITGDREPERFNQILYTVARAGNSKIKVFLCGNPDQNIEMCPYFYNLKIDYENLAENTVIYFNSIYKGKKEKNNICFVKLAGASDSEYLAVNVAGVFGDVETNMAFSGDVKHDEYMKITPQIQKDFRVSVHLEVQTAVIEESGAHKCVHAYIGTLKNIPVILIMRHAKIKGIPLLYNIRCIYDRRDLLFYDEMVSYRLTFTYYNFLDEILRSILEDGRIYTDSDMTAQTFINIYKNSRGVV